MNDTQCENVTFPKLIPKNFYSPTFQPSPWSFFIIQVICWLSYEWVFSHQHFWPTGKMLIFEMEGKMTFFDLGEWINIRIPNIRNLICKNFNFFEICKFLQPSGISNTHKFAADEQEQEQASERHKANYFRNDSFYCYEWKWGNTQWKIEVEWIEWEDSWAERKRNGKTFFTLRHFRSTSCFFSSFYSLSCIVSTTIAFTHL